MSRRSDRHVISSDDLAKQIIELGQAKKFGELQELIGRCDVKLVSTNVQYLFSISNSI